MPIVVLDCSRNAEQTAHDRRVELVETMLTLNERLAKTNTNHQQTIIQRQIDSTDRRIDQLVYKLYGLTAEEIQIVEEAAP